MRIEVKKVPYRKSLAKVLDLLQKYSLNNFGFGYERWRRNESDKTVAMDKHFQPFRKMVEVD